MINPTKPFFKRFEIFLSTVEDSPRFLTGREPFAGRKSLLEIPFRASRWLLPKRSSEVDVSGYTHTQKPSQGR